MLSTLCGSQVILPLFRDINDKEDVLSLSLLIKKMDKNIFSFLYSFSKWIICSYYYPLNLAVKADKVGKMTNLTYC